MSSGSLYGRAYNKDYTVLVFILGILIYGSPHVTHVVVSVRGGLALQRRRSNPSFLLFGVRDTGCIEPPRLIHKSQTRPSNLQPDTPNLPQHKPEKRPKVLFERPMWGSTLVCVRIKTFNSKQQPKNPKPQNLRQALYMADAVSWPTSVKLCSTVTWRGGE